jgi:hypothetical protein
MPESRQPSSDSSDIARAAGIAAGMALLQEAVGADRAAGAQVEDRASSIRITALKTFWVGPIVYVKIETNQGISGWGDLKAVDPRPAKVLVESLFELLDGENPTRIEYLWQKLFRAHRDMRGGAFMIHTIAAIDIALWDAATGKQVGEPIKFGDPDHPVVVRSVAFLPDGRHFLVARDNGDVDMWPVPQPVPDEPERIHAWIRARTVWTREGVSHRRLTFDEWSESLKKLAELGGPFPGWDGR